MSIDLNSVLQNEDTLVCLMLVLGGIIVLASIAIIQWRAVQKVKYNAHLKERLADHGYTSDEIIRIVNAGGITQQHCKPVQPHGSYEPLAN